MLHFTHAGYLFALVVVLPMVFGLAYAGYRAKLAARQSYGEARIVDRFTRRKTLASHLIGAALWTATAALLVVAAAGPTRPESPDEVRAGTMQVITVMDVSRSSGAEDYRGKMPGSPAGSTVGDGPSGSRLDMSKYQTLQIMQAISGNELGVVTYQGEGFAQADLTTDFTALKFVLKNFVKVGSAPGGGSDVGRGLRVAYETFLRDNAPNKTRVIVLISDGGFTGDAGELAKVLDDLHKADIKLIVIGVGSRSPIEIPQYDGTVFKDYVKKDGKVVTTTVEEGPLKAIANFQGCEYYYLAPGMTDLNIRWSTALGGSRSEPRVAQVYPYFLGAALLLLIALSLTGLSRKRDVV
jgi:hypothetical protein